MKHILPPADNTKQISLTTQQIIDVTHVARIISI